MSRTIHIKGMAEDIDILGSLSDNYDFPHDNFLFDEESEQIIKGTFFRFYECPSKCKLDEAIKESLTQYYGTAVATGQEFGYSEYTIEGFNVNSLKIGNHDIQEIIKSKKGKYLHILIDFKN